MINGRMWRKSLKLGGASVLGRPSDTGSWSDKQREKIFVDFLELFTRTLWMEKGGLENYG